MISVSSNSIVSCWFIKDSILLYSRSSTEVHCSMMSEQKTALSQFSVKLIFVAGNCSPDLDVTFICRLMIFDMLAVGDPAEAGESKRRCNLRNPVIPAFAGMTVYGVYPLGRNNYCLLRNAFSTESSRALPWFPLLDN